MEETSYRMKLDRENLTEFLKFTGNCCSKIEITMELGVLTAALYDIYERDKVIIVHEGECLEKYQARDSIPNNSFSAKVVSNSLESENTITTDRTTNISIALSVVAIIMAVVSVLLKTPTR